MRKRGLEIGVNAIVVLVFAVTVLGLGLAFIRGSFKDLTKDFSQVSDAIKTQIEEDILSSNEQLVFNLVNLDLKRSESKDIYFGIRNALDADATFSIKGSGNLDAAGVWDAKDSVISCFDAIDETARASASRAVTFDTFKSRMIPKGDVRVFILTVKASSSAKPTTYSCAMIIKSPVAADQYARKDFMVTVK